MAAIDRARLPFDEQIRFFRQKLGNLIPTERWTDVWKSQHDRGFMVAGAAKADLLADLARAVEAAIAEGKSIQWFRANFDEIVGRHGWAYQGERNWRTRVIYQTNISTSYAAGRLAQLRDPELQKLKPYWMYRHNDSVLHPRPLHLSWNGLTLPADHAWFKAHYPPNGWGCKCYIVAVSAQEAQRQGGQITDTPPDDGVDPNTGVPNGIDKGWDYMPGDTVTDDLRGQLIDKAQALPAPLRQALQQDLAPPPPWDPTTATGRWHEASFTEAPDWLRAAVGKAGEAQVTEKPGGHNFHRFGEIVIGVKRDSRQGQGSWRHEFGHFMDYKLRKKTFYRSAEADFTDAMESDGKALKDGSGLGRSSKAMEARRKANIDAYQAVMEDVRKMDPQERQQYLAKMASSMGLDYNKFVTWADNNGYIGTLSQGTVARDVYVGIALKAWGWGDAQGFLDAVEGVSKDVNGIPLGDAIINRAISYHRGTSGKLSDLFSAATHKRVEGSGCHPVGYYRQRPGWGRQVECWANLVTLVGDGEIGVQILERFVPNMLAVFRKII